MKDAKETKQSSEIGISGIVNSIGLPAASDGYIIDYIVNGKWRHVAGVTLVPDAEKSPSDLEFALNIIDMNPDKDITRNNVSHVARIYEYDGDQDQLMKACTDITLMRDIIQKHKYKIIVVHEQTFKKFMNGEG